MTAALLRPSAGPSLQTPANVTDARGVPGAFANIGGAWSRRGVRA
jgi:hypothetical protein